LWAAAASDHRALRLSVRLMMAKPTAGDAETSCDVGGVIGTQRSARSDQHTAISTQLWPRRISVQLGRGANTPVF
jgi:hypothetical protein